MRVLNMLNKTIALNVFANSKMQYGKNISIEWQQSDEGQHQKIRQ